MFEFRKIRKSSISFTYLFPPQSEKQCVYSYGNYKILSYNTIRTVKKIEEVEDNAKNLCILSLISVPFL